MSTKAITRLSRMARRMGVPTDAIKRTINDPLARKRRAARARADAIRALRIELDAQVARDDLAGALKSLAQLEELQKVSTFEAGVYVAENLYDTSRRAAFLDAVKDARQADPNSAFLLHLQTLLQALEGGYKDAGQVLLDKIEHPDTAARDLRAARHKMFQASWRVVDLIAREQMDWGEAGSSVAASDQGAGEAARTTQASPSGEEDTTEDGEASAADEGNDEEADALDIRLQFKEHFLQGRRREEYLDVCVEQLEKANSITAKLSAISDMLRTGIRHVPHYGLSHEKARQGLIDHEAAFERLFGTRGMRNPSVARKTILDLCNYLRLTRRLGLEAQATRVKSYLLHLSDDPEHAHALWPVPAMIAREETDLDVANWIMSRVSLAEPTMNRDVQNYFTWAMHAHEYEKADRFFERLPEHLRRVHGLLYYVNILQRQSRFEEALALLKEVHGQSLAKPARVSPVSNYSLMKRFGELTFLIETARIYQQAPQPVAPKGVVLVSPRNIDQLRRNPIMVFVEMKRRGWAVVPLVEGLLPVEPTGIAEIDVLIGSIKPNTNLSRAARSVMPDLMDFDFDPAAGRLTWGSIDLTHAIWEDSAINRRRYHVDYSCPELQNYVTGLANWTRSVARVLKYTHQKVYGPDRRIACVGLFNYRLPDAMFRFFCEEHGDPDTFFFLQAGNGYQNYFTNFSTNVSQRFVLRNMTRFRMARSASFPVPENFERYMIERQDEVPAIVERFAPITAVKRSTGDAKQRPEEATALDRRIAAWREKGGRVACAFGKVVCDSGVPFDGGPVHTSMKDWINHCIRAVRGSDTLLLIKPHPHEINNQIATFPTEFFEDLIEEDLGENAVIMGHRWFDMNDMKTRMDLGLVYNGTTAIELGIMGVPALLAGHFASIDYPIGHVVAQTREEFEAYVRFEKIAKVPDDIRERAAVWLDYMANERFTQPYRFHARPVTNKVLYPPFWFDADLDQLERGQDASVGILADRAIGQGVEPGGIVPDPVAG